MHANKSPSLASASNESTDNFYGVHHTFAYTSKLTYCYFIFLKKLQLFSIWYFILSVSCSAQCLSYKTELICHNTVLFQFFFFFSVCFPFTLIIIIKPSSMSFVLINKRWHLKKYAPIEVVGHCFLVILLSTTTKKQKHT